jgi:hypothetical protein
MRHGWHSDAYCISSRISCNEENVAVLNSCAKVAARTGSVSKTLPSSALFHFAVNARVIAAKLAATYNGHTYCACFHPWASLLVSSPMRAIGSTNAVAQGLNRDPRFIGRRDQLVTVKQ